MYKVQIIYIKGALGNNCKFFKVDEGRDGEIPVILKDV